MFVGEESLLSLIWYLKADKHKYIYIYIVMKVIYFLQCSGL